MDEIGKLLTLLADPKTVAALAGVEGFAPALEAAKGAVSRLTSEADSSEASRVSLERKAADAKRALEAAKAEIATLKAAGSTEDAAAKIAAAEAKATKAAEDAAALRGELHGERVLVGARDALDKRGVPADQRAAILELLQGKRLAGVERKDDGTLAGLDAAIEKAAGDFPKAFNWGGGGAAPAPGNGGGNGTPGTPPRPAGPTVPDATKAAQAAVDRMFAVSGVKTPGDKAAAASAPAN